MARKWLFWLGLLISLLFLWWAIQQATDLVKVGKWLRQANYLYLIPALLVYFVGVYLRALRWRFLLEPIQTIEVRQLFPIVVMGYMANNVLPARMGELFRAYILGEYRMVSKSAILATIVIERVFDVIALIVFILIVSLAMPMEQELQRILYFVALLLACLSILLLSMVLWPQLTLKTSDLVLRILPPQLSSRLAGILTSFLAGLQVLQSGKLLLLGLGSSLAVWLCEASMYYTIMFAFNLSLPFSASLLATAVANLGTIVPSSPGYVGTFDALTVFTLKLFGADPNVALGYTVVLHAALLIPITLLGFYYLWRYSLSLRAIERQEEDLKL
ncbi:MAG: flippase-like domain-containing protein [Chloroflexi bacterium]|nr:flippase-like domain-containing protein [Chloroflexota bacterium]MCL5075559.1 flippase-like domain-containing protein [Chloroflexota bacterium]